MATVVGAVVAYLQLRRTPKPGEIFHHSWYEVLVNDDHARRALMVMGLHPGPVAREALEAGADVHGPSLTKAITRLIGLSLLDTSAARGSPTPDFEIHTLTASFVVGVLRSEPAVRVDLEARLVRYYLDLAVRHSPTVLGVEHVRALERERANILCFAQSCYRVATDRGDVGSLRQVVSFAEALASYLWARGYWQDQLEVCGRALDAASRIGDADSAVEQRCLIGRIHVWRGELMKAREQLEASEAVLTQVGSEAVRARALRLRAWIASHEGNHREATACLERVLETAPDTHDDHGRAATLVDLGVEAEATGEMQLALDRYREALVLDEAVSCLEGAAVSLSHLADVELELGLHDDARRHCSEGLAKAKVVDRLSTIGRCQRGLARVLCQEGQFDDARRHAVWAAESYRRLGIPELEAEASSLVDAADAGLASVDRVDEDEVDSETV